MATAPEPWNIDLDAAPADGTVVDLLMQRGNGQDLIGRKFIRVGDRWRQVNGSLFATKVVSWRPAA